MLHPGVAAFVLDNSPTGLDPGVLPPGIGLFRPDSPLSFTQSMNFACFEADQRDVRWLIFMHNDASADVTLIDDLLSLGEQNLGDSRVGVFFTAYDAVAAFNMDAVRDVGAWDETWRWYASDIDYYHRLRTRGWQVCDSPFGHRVSHEISATLGAGADAAALKDDYSYEFNHYAHKWGGGFGQERFTIPYNGNP